MRLFGLSLTDILTPFAPQERCVPLVAVALGDPIETGLELQDMNLGRLRMLRVRGDQVGLAV